MHWLFHAARRFFRAQTGVTGVEYAVLLAMVCVAAIAGIRLLGIKNSDLMNNVANQLPDGQGSSTPGQSSSSSTQNGSSPGQGGSTPGKSGSKPGKKP